MKKITIAATETDQWPAFLALMKRDFTGFAVEQGTTAWKDNTDRWGNGNKVMAKGNASAEEPQGAGAAKFKFVESDDYSFYIIDAKITCRYNSNTHGEQYECAVGQCTYVNTLWDDLGPKGSINVHYEVDIRRSISRCSVEIVIDPDHNDDPGHFVAEQVVVKMRPKIIELFKKFTGIDQVEEHLSSMGQPVLAIRRGVLSIEPSVKKRK